MATCPHPASRLYAWFAHDGTLCICCSDCGAVLEGGVTLNDPEPDAGPPAEPPADQE